MVDFAFFPTAEGNPKGAVSGMRSGPPVVSIYGRSRNAEAAYKLLEAALAPASMNDMARKYRATCRTAWRRCRSRSPPIRPPPIC